ncbi:MAG: hypothetical protein LC660_18165 [Desulfobacteraceae bacterium]|nr:hypothetical protein [Desulfobacteraceae bacterium]
MHILTPVHTRVKGRARFTVSGLKRSESFKHLLTEQLTAKDGIFGVKASTVTGKILVFYDQKTPLQTIAETLQTVILSIKQQKNATASAEHKPPRGQQAPSRQKDASSRMQKVKNRVQSILRHRQADVEKEWHVVSGQDAAAFFQSDIRQGISRESVLERRQQFGENVLPKTRCRSGMQIFMEQMNSLPVYLLGAVAGVSIVMGGILDAAIVFGVVLANAAIGYVTESKAEKNIDALNDLVHHMAEVLRDGKSLFISAEAVVPGDMLVLKPGSFVPADSRIIQASRLTIDESMLTGESLPQQRFLKDFLP